MSSNISTKICQIQQIPKMLWDSNNTEILQIPPVQVAKIPKIPQTVPILEILRIPQIPTKLLKIPA